MRLSFGRQKQKERILTPVISRLRVSMGRTEQTPLITFPESAQVLAAQVALPHNIIKKWGYRGLERLHYIIQYKFYKF